MYVQYCMRYNSGYTSGYTSVLDYGRVGFHFSPLYNLMNRPGESVWMVPGTVDPMED